MLDISHTIDDVVRITFIKPNPVNFSRNTSEISS